MHPKSDRSILDKPHLHICVRVLLAAPLLIGLVGGCGLGSKLGGFQETGQDAVAALDRAIDALERNSAAWQSVLQNTTKELAGEAQSTIRNEVADVLNRSVAAAGTEFRCDLDFIGTRVRQALIRIRARLLGQTIPPVEPALCQVVPAAIDMGLDPSRRNKLEFFGYDFDTSPITVTLHDQSGNTIDVTNSLDRLTHYHMTLNLGLNGVPLTSTSNRITLEWQGKQISSVAIIQPATPVCREQTEVYARDTYLSFTPPHTRGDREYKGHGPQVWANAQWTHDDFNVILRLWMKAEETQSDWTTAEGERYETYYVAPPGWRIESLSGGMDSSAHYTDTDHEEDRLGGGPSGPIREFVFRGDRSGDDAGIHTGVDVYFNPLTVNLVEVGDCVSTRSLKMLRSVDLLAPATLERLGKDLVELDRNE
jgi:hypothetical protein